MKLVFNPVSNLKLESEQLYKKIPGFILYKLDIDFIMEENYIKNKIGHVILDPLSCTVITKELDLKISDFIYRMKFLNK